MRAGDVAAVLRSIKGRRVTCLTGAGTSVAAGIPDFRSPGGMYDTLRPDLLTAEDWARGMMNHDPTVVVSWELFRENPLPYLELRRPFIMGTGSQQWKGTLTHFFFRLLHDKGMLRRLYTQNIDGLDLQTGIPDDLVVSVHGSMGKIQCESCEGFEDYAWFKEQLSKNIKDIYGVDSSAPAESTPILCRSCGAAALKPATVLYGRSLPKRFFDLSDDDCDATDVMFIVGTSLTVYPAASLPALLPQEAVRVVVNRDPVGGCVAAEKADPERNIYLSGNCDDAFLAIAEELGWVEELRKFASQMCESSQKLLAASKVEGGGGGGGGFGSGASAGQTGAAPAVKDEAGAKKPPQENEDDTRDETRSASEVVQGNDASGDRSIEVAEENADIARKRNRIETK